MAKDEIVINIKTNVKDASKGTEDLAKNTGTATKETGLLSMAMGKFKMAMAAAGKTAKMLFGSIKAGIMSTGIGALVLSVVALVSYFKNTQRGAEMLERAMAGLGAVMDVLTDLFSSAGETLVGVFTDPKQAIKDLWEFIKDNLMNRLTGLIDGFKAAGKIIQSALKFDWEGVKEGAEEYGQALIQVGTGMDIEQQKAFIDGIKEIGKEMNNEADAAMRLKGIMQDVRREEMKFSKVQAETRQEVAKARLLAMDESLSQEKRLEAINEVMKKEMEMTEGLIALQKKKVAAKKEELSLGESMIEDEEELMALEVELINLTTQSTMTQKRLMTEVEALNLEIIAKEKQASKDAQKIIDDEWAAKIKANDEWNKEQQKAAKEEIALAKKVAAAKKLLDDKLADTKQATLEMGAAAAMKIAGEGTAVGKSVAVAMAIMNTKEAITAALGMKPYGPWNIAQAIATGIFGMTQIKGIIATPIPGGGGGGGGGSVSVPSATPRTTIASGAFTLEGGVEPEPTRAYVVSDDITDSQNALANIRRRATI